ncbi:COP23 domain-containing protein [Iningainema tapete]|uniref:Uncharacterized protein n=1 Tax=Iningainema tapete BLCC-T55 TaxID=2748662 RepID=A0A8J6Y383_9CYAN|nr:COP23 domain-containing protein [Iningainema tapete]MBD2778783.1 hypothetical protein [Iningainema tapete BLCC-T55]
MSSQSAIAPSCRSFSITVMLSELFRTNRVYSESWSDYFSRAGQAPQTRCQKVSERFQTLYDKGFLNYITSDRLNGENVVCVAPDEKSPCIDNGLLFTLKPDEKPAEVVQHIFDIRDDKTKKPLEETERIYINVKQHLDTDSVEPQRNW